MPLTAVVRMAIDGGERGGYVPQLGVEGVTPADVIEDARRSNLVIECTGASGSVHSFVYTGVGGLWAARCELGNGSSGTWLTNPSREATIRNCIERCTPDVLLVSEEASTFGREDDE